MATTTEHHEDLADVEAEAARRLEADEGRVETDVDAATDVGEPPPSVDDRNHVRVAVATALPVVAAGLMVGGVFAGARPRVDACVAGVLGVGLASVAARIRRAAATNTVVVVGLFAIGLLLIAPTGLSNVTGVGGLATKAARSGNVLRPPVAYTAGWHAIVGWLMACAGFTAGWIALTLNRTALGLLAPLPVAAIAGISVPKDQQVGSGIAVLALFAIGLAVLAGAQTGADDEQRPTLAFELRRAAKSVPLVAAITVALYFLAQANFLFPKPYVDPTRQPQRPRTTPLSQVPDRVLFEVESSVTGPWRIGSLDVYDGRDWRLPPFSESKLRNVPRSGVVDPDLQPGARAAITIAGLGGAVLPGLPNLTGVIAEGPTLAYDGRNGSLRVAQGAVQAGLKYVVTAAAVPSVEDLKADAAPVPPSLRRFTEIPPPPPAAAALLDSARAKGRDRWTQFDYARNWVLDNVTASGPGVPKSIPPERAQQILGSSKKEASPFEIVAVQAMLARWLGVPSRIGYGFDGGDQVNGKVQVRPRNGASFVEVFFPNFKWLPVIGNPRHAHATVSNDTSQQQFDPNVLPSNDIAVQLYLPVVAPPKSVLAEQLQRIVLAGGLALLVAALLYVAFPALHKAVVRSRRRAAAFRHGPRARIALAYSEWRDVATDFGFQHATDTPLMFLDRFVPDDEHVELAWLVTRALWGDLRETVDDGLATSAEELSRALRRRLAQSQPATVRVVSFVSRLSLRRPYAPDLHQSLRAKEPEDAIATA